MSEEKKKIEIVNGDGSNLDISNVYDHLNPAKPKSSDDKPKNIVIPEEHKNALLRARLLVCSQYFFAIFQHMCYNYNNQLKSYLKST